MTICTEGTRVVGVELSVAMLMVVLAISFHQI